MMFNKILLVTDMPVDDYRELARRVFRQIDFHTDLVFGKGPLDVLDHASPRFAFGSKLGIDATSKWTEELVVGSGRWQSGENQKMKIEGREWQTAYISVTDWNMSLLDDDIPVVILTVREPDAKLSVELARRLLQDEQLSTVKLFVMLDDTVDIHDLNTIVWLACANVDPERDITIAGEGRQQMVVDACMKYPQRYGFERDWPNVVTSSKMTISAIDQKWEQLGLGKFIPSPTLHFLKMKKGDGAIADQI